jgi:chemotaxis protein MotA
MEGCMKSIIIGIFIIALALFSTTVFRNIGMSMAFNPDAFAIVIGGTIVAIFFGFPVARLKKTFANIIDTFRPQRDRLALSKDILAIARTSRRADIRGLEKQARSINDDFLKQGVNLLLTTKSNEEIRTIMEKEMAMRIMDFNFSQNVLKTIARLTPSFGLAGTVISLINMFKNMQSIDSIAAPMAMAMMSTFYGVIISNLFMMPLCAKLEERAIQTEALMHGVIEGILSINAREHPLLIAERMNGYRDTQDTGLSGTTSELALARGVSIGSGFPTI